jgi:hypothetical protein
MNHDSTDFSVIALDDLETVSGGKKHPPKLTPEESAALNEQIAWARAEGLLPFDLRLGAG